MAKNYEAICESLRLAGEQKLVKLSNTFQEHQKWLKQAFEDARAQLAAQKEKPRSAKPGRGKGAADKVCPAELTQRMHWKLWQSTSPLGDLRLNQKCLCTLIVICSLIPLPSCKLARVILGTSGYTYLRQLR